MGTRVSYSNSVIRIRDSRVRLTSAVTLTKGDSGKTYLLDAATGFTVTLPALAEGLNFKFFVSKAFATDNWVIASAEGDNISGNLVVVGAAVPAAAEDFINFVASAESIGDFVEIFADVDNSQWIVYGVGNLTGAITATDPS
jgi:hypothetical protein